MNQCGGKYSLLTQCVAVQVSQKGLVQPAKMGQNRHQTCWSQKDLCQIVLLLPSFLTKNMHKVLSYDQLWAASLTGQNAITWHSALLWDSALETFMIIALYKSTFTIPYHTIPWVGVQSGYCGTCASGVVQGRRGSLGHRRVGVQPGSVLQQPRAAARCVRRVRESRTSVYSAVTRPRDVRRPADGHADSRYDDDSSRHRLLASNVCSCTHRNRLSGRGAHKELAQQ